MYSKLHVNGVQLYYKDFGGDGPPLLLLHGLFGRATTWANTARWLTPHYHVIGLDQRGHGLSDKPRGQYTRDDYVNDLIAVIEALDFRPAVVVGHSMGALNAWVLAARRPDLVRALVLEDMSAATARPGDGGWVRDWLSQWPVPFAAMGDLLAYFRQEDAGTAEYMAEVMTEHPDGYRPFFRMEDMIESAAQIDSRDHWTELDAVRCPTLVVKGERSDNPRAELLEMARRIPGGKFVAIPEAGHVVHYDQPVAWRVAVEPFLLEVRAAVSPR